MTADLPRLVAYYRRRYEHPPGPFRDYRAYLPLLGAAPGDRVLDVGCGEGFLLAELDRAGAAPFGVEIVDEALRPARDRVPGARLARAQGEALPFRRRSFDRVACLGSLEHFADPARGASEIARVLAPGGTAVVVVPNRRFAGWLVTGHAGTEQREIAELLLDEPGWRRLLEAGGLVVERVAKEPWHTKPYRSRWVRAALRLANRLLPRRWTYQFAFVCRAA